MSRYDIYVARLKDYDLSVYDEAVCDPYLTEGERMSIIRKVKEVCKGFCKTREAARFAV